MTGVGLLHLAVDLAQILLLGHKVLLAVLDHQHHQACRHRQDHQGDKGHQRRDGKHHHQHTDEGGHRGNEGCHRLVQALSQGIHIVGDAGEDLAYGTGLKILHGHAVDFLRNVPPQTVAGLLRDSAHDPALEQREARADQVEDDEHPQNLPDLAEVDAAAPLDLGHQTGKDLGGGLGKHFGSYNIENGRAYGEDAHQGQLKLEPAHMGEQFLHRTLKILGLLTGYARASVAHGPPGTGRCLPLTHAPTPPNSASDSWLRAIS